MRQREFVIQARGLKNNSRVYAFFDGINVTANCYQIQLIGSNTTLQSLNSQFDNTGYLNGEGVTWKAIVSGSTYEIR
jgi:thiamine monophosphate kinase